MWLVSIWSWGPATSSDSVSGRGLGQSPHALLLPTKATQPTCLCLSLLPSSSAKHLSTNHWGQDRGQAYLQTQVVFLGTCTCTHTHTHRGHVRHGGQTTPLDWPHSHRGEVALGRRACWLIFTQSQPEVFKRPAGEGKCSQPDS